VQRGDIVIYKIDERTFARRLIGLPGDVISVADGGIFIDKKPIDTTFLEKGAPILPTYDNYAIPPNRIVVGTGAKEPGKFWLIEIDKPSELRYGEVVYFMGAITRGTILAMVAGAGYVLLLTFGPLIAERFLDPGERHYGVLKFVWYAFCTIGFLALLVPFFIAINDWNFSAWQNVQVALVIINLELTSLLGYFGATLKQSAIVSLVIGLSGIASVSAWVSKFWRQIQFKAVDEVATPGTDPSKQLPEKRSQ
jgi:hypothetical protein